VRATEMGRISANIAIYSATARPLVGDSSVLSSQPGAAFDREVVGWLVADLFCFGTSTYQCPLRRWSAIDGRGGHALDPGAKCPAQTDGLSAIARQATGTRWNGRVNGPFRVRGRKGCEFDLHLHRIATRENAQCWMARNTLSCCQPRWGLSPAGWEGRRSWEVAKLMAAGLWRTNRLIIRFLLCGVGIFRCGATCAPYSPASASADQVRVGHRIPKCASHTAAAAS
jgi:hypothetical protein